ncbi:MAG TPA: response regulator transcription factor [Anaerolineales bacterium]|nr:response regulator transcription factor [Anaerolineales bacterium]
MPTIAIIEDFPLMLTAVKNLLMEDPDLQVVATAAHGKELDAILSTHAVEVLLLDLGMATGYFEPISAIKRARETYPALKIIVLTSYDAIPYVRDVIKAGAHGYLLKDDVETLDLPAKIRTVMQGGRVFSARIEHLLYADHLVRPLLFAEEQIAILRLMAQDCDNEEAMARETGLTPLEVSYHVTLLYARLKIPGAFLANPTHRRTAVLKALEWGLIPALRAKDIPS